MFRTLAPQSEEVDVVDLYMSDRRSVDGRPWMMFNMVASIDGATALYGSSTALNDKDDRDLFHVLRAVPDVILVGAGTVRAEDYGPVSLDARRRELREAQGQSAAPLLAIVTGRLSLDPEARVFSDPEYRPMVITSTNADPGKLALLGDAAEVVILQPLTAEAILDQLAAASVILCEGGPTLNGQFVAAGLVDEMNVTVSPLLLSGDSSKIARGEQADPPLGMRLDRALVGDRSLFLRYLRSEHQEGS
jgi:riboflavin-specific deaminase-like protein